MASTPASSILLQDLPANFLSFQSFQFHTPGFAGNAVPREGKAFTEQGVILTNEQLIALTLNDAAADHGRGKFYWLSSEIVAGPGLCY